MHFFTVMRKNTVALNQAITYNDTQSKFIGRLRNWITSLSNFSIERALESALKSRSSKRYILLDAIKTVFPMFDIVAALFVNFRCMIRAVRGTSEAQLNMDVNLRRLPECTMSMPKFLVLLAGFMPHLQLADSTATPSKQRKDSLQSSKTYT